MWANVNTGADGCSNHLSSIKLRGKMRTSIVLKYVEVRKYVEVSGSNKNF